MDFAIQMDHKVKIKENETETTEKAKEPERDDGTNYNYDTLNGLWKLIKGWKSWKSEKELRLSARILIRVLETWEQLLLHRL